MVVNSAIDPAAPRAAGLRLRTYIGTNDFGAGRLAGTEMASVLHRNGDVALVGGVADNLNNHLRLGGFERGIRGVAAVHGSRLPARVDAPIALVTQANVARATASFPGRSTAIRIRSSASFAGAEG